MTQTSQYVQGQIIRYFFSVTKRASMSCSRVTSVEVCVRCAVVWSSGVITPRTRRPAPAAVSTGLVTFHFPMSMPQSGSGPARRLGLNLDRTRPHLLTTHQIQPPENVEFWFYFKRFLVDNTYFLSFEFYFTQYGAGLISIFYIYDIYSLHLCFSFFK